MCTGSRRSYPAPSTNAICAVDKHDSFASPCRVAREREVGRLDAMPYVAFGQRQTNQVRDSSGRRITRSQSGQDLAEQLTFQLRALRRLEFDSMPASSMITRVCEPMSRT